MVPALSSELDLLLNQGLPQIGKTQIYAYCCWLQPNNPNHTTRGNTEIFVSQIPLVKEQLMISEHLSSNIKSTSGPVRMILSQTQRNYTLQFSTSKTQSLITLNPRLINLTSCSLLTFQNTGQHLYKNYPISLDSILQKMTTRMQLSQSLFQLTKRQ